MLIIGNVLDVPIGSFFWPAVLILAGIWLILRPWWVGPDTAVHQKLIGDLRRDGAWQVTNEDYYTFVGDINLDLTHAEIPLGETRIRVYSFVADVRVRVPESIGVSLLSTAFVTEARLLGQKEDSFVSPVHLTTDGYEASERRVRLELFQFIAGVKVTQA